MVNNSGAELSAVFSALADPTRRAILDNLRVSQARVIDVARPFGMSIPAISRHLKLLEQAGLIEKIPEGRETLCRIKPGTPAMRLASSWIQTQTQFWNDRLDSLEIFLASNELVETEEEANEQQSNE